MFLNTNVYFIIQSNNVALYFTMIKVKSILRQFFPVIQRLDVVHTSSGARYFTVVWHLKTDDLSDITSTHTDS